MNKNNNLLWELKKIANIKAQRDLKSDWYQGSETYLNALIEEVEEVRFELNSGRKCFLEDELGDLLWDFVCLIEHLEIENKIDKDKVFSRSVKKYSERVIERNKGETWNEVKYRQKVELKKELQASGK